MGNAPLEIRDEKRLIKPKYSQVSRFIPENNIYKQLYMRLFNPRHVQSTPMFICFDAPYNKLSCRDNIPNDVITTEDAKTTYEKFGFLPAQYIHYTSINKDTEYKRYRYVIVRDNLKDLEYFKTLGYTDCLIYDETDYGSSISIWKNFCTDAEIDLDVAMKQNIFVFVVEGMETIPQMYIDILGYHNFIDVLQHHDISVGIKLRYIHAIYYKNMFSKIPRYLCFFAEEHRAVKSLDYIQLINIILKKIPNTTPVYFYVESHLDSDSFEKSAHVVEAQNPESYTTRHASIKIDGYRDILDRELTQFFKTNLTAYIENKETKSLFLSEAMKATEELDVEDQKYYRISCCYLYVIVVNLYLKYYLNRAIIMGDSKAVPKELPFDLDDFAFQIPFQLDPDYDSTDEDGISKGQEAANWIFEDFQSTDKKIIPLLKEDAYTTFLQISKPPEFKISDSERNILSICNDIYFKETAMDYFRHIEYSVVDSCGDISKFYRSYQMHISVIAPTILDNILVQSISMTPENSVIVMAVGDAHRQHTEKLLHVLSTYEQFSLENPETSWHTEYTDKNFYTLSSSADYFGSKKILLKNRMYIDFKQQIFDLIITLEANIRFKNTDADGDQTMPDTATDIEDVKGGTQHTPDTYRSDTYRPDTDITIGVQSIVIAVILVVALFVVYVAQIFQNNIARYPINRPFNNFVQVPYHFAS